MVTVVVGPVLHHRREVQFEPIVFGDVEGVHLVGEVELQYAADGVVEAVFGGVGDDFLV